MEKMATCCLFQSILIKWSFGKTSFSDFVLHDVDHDLVSFNRKTEVKVDIQADLETTLQQQYELLDSMKRLMQGEPTEVVDLEADTIPSFRAARG